MPQYKGIKKRCYHTASSIRPRNHTPDSDQIPRKHWYLKILKPGRIWGQGRRVLAGLGGMALKDIDIFLSDIGLTRASLHALGKSHPSDFKLLPRMLQRIGLGGKGKIAGSILRDMQRTCLHCNKKKECAKWLEQEQSNSRHPLFCPNSFTFEGIKNPQWPL